MSKSEDQAAISAIGSLLTEEREKAGLTQRDLVARSGIPKTTIHDIEHGKEPRITTLLKLAEALDIPMTRFREVAFENGLTLPQAEKSPDAGEGKWQARINRKSRDPGRE